MPRDSVTPDIGHRFQSGNYGPLVVYETADLADRFRIVGLIVEGGRWAGTKVGIPEHELGPVGQILDQ